MNLRVAEWMLILATLSTISVRVRDEACDNVKICSKCNIDELKLKI